MTTYNTTTNANTQSHLIRLREKLLIPNGVIYTKCYHSLFLPLLSTVKSFPLIICIVILFYVWMCSSIFTTSINFILEVLDCRISYFYGFSFIWGIFLQGFSLTHCWFVHIFSSFNLLQLLWRSSLVKISCCKQLCVRWCFLPS